MEKIEKWIVDHISTSVVIVIALTAILWIRGCVKSNKLERADKKIEYIYDSLGGTIDSLSSVIHMQSQELSHRDSTISQLRRDVADWKLNANKQADKKTVVNNTTRVQLKESN